MTPPGRDFAGNERQGQQDRSREAVLARESARGRPSQPATADLRMLFHSLNNQLGIILAHVELLEAKAADEEARTRAAQPGSSVHDAMGTAREIRSKTAPSVR